MAILCQMCEAFLCGCHLSVSFVNCWDSVKGYYHLLNSATIDVYILYAAHVIKGLTNMLLLSW